MCRPAATLAHAKDNFQFDATSDGIACMHSSNGNRKHIIIMRRHTTRGGSDGKGAPHPLEKTVSADSAYKSDNAIRSRRCMRFGMDTRKLLVHG